MAEYNNNTLEYEDTLYEVLYLGTFRPDRTGVGTLSTFSAKISYNLEDGFPLITTKKVHFKSVVAELLWFLRGETNTAYLKEHGVTIWDEWADENGDLGPVYGKQWRTWEDKDGNVHDQIANVIKSIKEDPYSRRHVVSAWNVGELDEMALQPCHVLFQFYVADGKLSVQVYQRSADIFLGVPFNLASYALLTHIIAQQTGLGVGWLHWVGGDVHLYKNHIQQATELITRVNQYPIRPLPHLQFVTERATIEEYQVEDFQLIGYDPYPAIKAEVAV